MEIKVSKIPEDKEERVLIECHEVTPQISQIVRFVRSFSRSVIGEKEDREYELSIHEIYYAESVDNRTFLYTGKQVYSSHLKLYELEEMLAEESFFRISKSVVVNLLKITSIRPALNGRFSAVLSNGEEVIISRKYVADFKEKIRGGRHS